MPDSVVAPDAGETRARAYGAPLLTATLRTTPADFQVSEELGFEPAGEGEHDFLWVEKIGANTAWVARQLALVAGVESRDVGYSGLKDRHAITRQWFSVRRPNRDGTDWRQASIEGVTILDIGRNGKKLRRGVHRANHFRIALRSNDVKLTVEAIRARLTEISARGLPNYFGEQRFGRGGGNVKLALQMFSGKRLKRDARSHAISAARSFLFNAILERRVIDDTWDHLIPGDVANLDGTGSVFNVGVATTELRTRCREQDLHPTATLWGDGAPLVSGAAAEIETNVAAKYPALAEGLTTVRMNAAYRPLRVRVRNLDVEFDDDVVWLQFRLPTGAFATTLMQELADYDSRSST